MKVSIPNPYPCLSLFDIPLTKENTWCKSISFWQSLCLFVFVCVYISLLHIPHTPSVRVLDFWTQFDLAMIDCCCVHSSCSGHLFTSLVTGEWGKKRRMSWRRRDGFIDARLGLRSMHQSLDDGGWWGLWVSGTTSYSLDHTFIYATLCLIYATRSFSWELLPIVLSDGKSS